MIIDVLIDDILEKDYCPGYNGAHYKLWFSEGGCTTSAVFRCDLYELSDDCLRLYRKDKSVVINLNVPSFVGLLTEQ